MKKILTPNGSAKVIGAYSHGLEIDLTKAKQLVFITGQIAIDENGNAIAPNDIITQTEYVFTSIQNILKESSLTLNNVVKVVIYVRNMEDFPKISSVRNKYLMDSKPVSTLVEISATVKEGCDIEIEVIAMK